MNNSGEIEKTMGGQLDEVLVWSRALTQEEIKSYMLTTPEQGATDLIAYYNFSHRRGNWVENVATGQYDARLTNGARVSQAEALADSDGDGLTDRDELALGTDADKADTDGDGLSDGVEMGVESGVYLSSPLLTDTDRDGIPDGFEYEVGSDLLTPDAGNDADGDGKTNWQDYVVAVADESSEQAIEDINGVLDVANNNGYLQTGIHPNGNQPMTVMMWVKLNSVELSQRSGVLDHSGRRFYFGINEQNNAYIGMGKKYSSEYRASLKSGEWAHFAISYDPTGSGRYQIYINGHAHSYGTSLAFDGQSKWAILFGALNNEGTIIDPMAGELDDIQVWSKTLTQEEVRGFMVTEPKSGISDLIAHYNFSNRRGDWVENVATGQYDARLTKGAWISAIEASLDSDSDGLTDRKELAFGTDAENWDTDGDGLSDGVEMGVDSGIYLSSPLLTDTDRDGIPDGFEYEVGSDLLVSDATSDENGNGKTNWQEYLESVSELNASEPLVEDDRVLDVAGGTKYLETGIHPKGGESMTFMYWVKYDAIGSAYQLSGTHDGKSHRFYLGLKKAQLTGGVGSDTDYGVSAGLEVGQWAHLALVYNAESARFEMYVNGELNNYETYVRFNGESLYGLLIGALNGAEGIKNIQEAQIDDVQVWSRAFNQSEIQSYMLTPPQSEENGLIAYYNFSRSRGDWVENVATGQYDARLMGGAQSVHVETLIDSDGDGLADRYEIALGTDEANVDTDGDGLSDGVEMGVDSGVYLSSPLLTDTDRDGIPDGFEYEVGSDLLVSDATSDENGNGKTNWQEYLESVSELNASEPLVEDDRVLDVAGGTKYLETGIHPKGGESMTFMYWVKYDAIGSAYQLSGTHDGKSHRFYLGLKKAQLTGGVGSDTDYGVSAGLEVGQWAHLALVYNAESARFEMYVNGELNNYETYVRFNGESLYGLLIGALNGAEGIKNIQEAQIDDVQVWSRAFNQSEIQSYMLTPPQRGENDLTAYYNFSRSRGNWIENVATGRFDAKLSGEEILSLGSHE